MQFSSNKPYLLRAIYEWVVDNEGTPHVVLFADNPQVIVPQQYIDNGKIILNISPTAAEELLIDAEGLSFKARFGGSPYEIFSPMNAIMSLYASETGEGMSFDIENEIPPDDTPPKPSGPKSLDKATPTKKPAVKPNKSKRPALKIVK